MSLVSWTEFFKYPTLGVKLIGGWATKHSCRCRGAFVEQCISPVGNSHGLADFRIYVVALACQGVLGRLRNSGIRARLQTAIG